MRTIPIIIAIFAALPTPAILAGSPFDAGAQGYVEPGHAHVEGQGASQEQIIESVQKRYNAKVVRVTHTSFDGRPALQLRLLSAQRVWTIVIDASSGQTLSGG
jgi:hypothetical protein